MSNETKEVLRDDQIKIVYDELGGVIKAEQEVLNKICAEKQIEPVIEAGEYNDFAYQIESDTKMSALMKDILEALSRIQYLPQGMSAEGRKALLASNDAIRVEIAKLIEKHAIPYILLENVNSEIGTGLKQIVEQAVRVMQNKTAEVLMHIAKSRLNVEELTMREVADYAEEVYNTVAEKKANEAKEQ